MSDTDGYIAVMREYIATIRAVVGISAGVLVFPITIIKALQGGNDPLLMNWKIVFAIVALGISVLLGLTYQLMATRLIAQRMNFATTALPAWLERPVWFYAFTVIAMYLGLLFLVWGLLGWSPEIRPQPSQ